MYFEYYEYAPRVMIVLQLIFTPVRVLQVLYFRCTSYLLGAIKRILGESGNPAGIQKNANETSQEPACCQIVRNGDMVSAKVVVTYKKGMHARPAGILAAKMYGYKSKVEIIIHGRSYNAKSVLLLIASGIRNRDEITIQCKGPDSEEALIKAIELFENDFGFKSD